MAVTERRRPLEEAIAAAEALPCGDDRRTGTPSAEASAGETDEKRAAAAVVARPRTDALALRAPPPFVAAEEYAFETDGGSAGSAGGASVPDTRVRLATLLSAYERALAQSANGRGAVAAVHRASRAERE